MIRILHCLPLLALPLLGCSSAADRPDPTTGSVSLALRSNGVTLTSITYTITGHGFTRSAVVNVEHSTTISALIGGLRVGSYQIELQATDAQDPTIECFGAGGFDIFAQQTTSTRVNLYCHQPSNDGSVAITGDVQLCPTIRSLSAEPAQVRVGHSILLYANADDPGAGLYVWTASQGGSLADADSWHPTLTCTRPGHVYLTLTLTSLAGLCQDSATAIVACVGTSPDDPNQDTPGDDRIGYKACVNESCGPDSVCCPTIGACAKSADECPAGEAQTCDGPEDCPVAGELCSVHLHGMHCAVPVYGWDVLCHTDDDCLSTPGTPNPCNDIGGQWGQCRSL